MKDGWKTQKPTSQSLSPHRREGGTEGGAHLRRKQMSCLKHIYC